MGVMWGYWGQFGMTGGNGGNWVYGSSAVLGTETRHLLGLAPISSLRLDVLLIMGSQLWVKGARRGTEPSHLLGPFSISGSRLVEGRGVIRDGVRGLATP